MPVVIGFLMTVVLLVALAHGIESGRVALVKRYRASAAKWRAQHPASPHAARLAGFAAAVVYGTGPATRATWRGFRDEWIAGRDRVRERYPDRYPPPVDTAPPEREEPEPAAPDLPAPPQPEPAPQADSPWQPEQPAPEPETTRPFPQPWQPVVIDGGRASEPRTGDSPVSALPVIEIRTIGNVRDAVKAYADAARAEHDDAAAELARAQADVTWLTSLGEQSAQVLDRDPTAAAAVQKLLESAQQRAAAAQTRVAAADAAAAQAAQALQLLAQHRGMEEARDATPQASTSTDRYAGV